MGGSETGQETKNIRGRSSALFSVLFAEIFYQRETDAQVDKAFRRGFKRRAFLQLPVNTVLILSLPGNFLLFTNAGKVSICCK